jgi:hypothetical protein
VPKLDPALERVLVALARGLRRLDVGFCVVGALVPDLLLKERPDQATLDADVVVFVPDLATFERVKGELAGFEPTTYPYRLSMKAADVPTFFRTARSLSKTAC